MKLNHKDLKEKKTEKSRNAFSRAAIAAATALLINFSPVFERNAKAQDAPEPTLIAVPPIPVSSETASPAPSEAAAPAPSGAAVPASAPAEVVTATSAEPAKEIPPAASSSAESSSQPDDLTGVPPWAKDAPEKNGSPAQQTQQDVFFSNFNLDRSLVLPASDYHDPALNRAPGIVDIRGKTRTLVKPTDAKDKISFDNKFDLGGGIVVNEAGMAAFGSSAYRDLAMLDFGAIKFTDANSAPFLRLMLTPEAKLWRFKGGYYGSLAFAGDMPSWLYTSHSLGLGFSYPIKLGSEKDQKLWIRTGVVSGGALSHPAYDDIYFNIVPGISLQLTGFPNNKYDYLVYAMPNWYFAADDPIKSSYVKYYSPKYQGIELGAQVRFLDDYSIGAVFDLATLRNRFGTRFTWTRSYDTYGLDMWAGAGLTNWTQAMGGRTEPYLMVGATFVFGGEKVNNTFTARLEEFGDTGVNMGKTNMDMPDKLNPGPYGYGRSGNGLWDEPVNLAKERILSAQSFDEFKAAYEGASQEDVIKAARFLGAFLQQVAYSNDAMNALYSKKFFDGAVQRIASSDTEDMFGYMKEYVDWYNTHDPKEDLPEHLQNGIAVCAGIHWMVADFLRANGVKALVATVNTREGPHVVAIAKLQDKTMLLDYGNTYETGPGSVDEVMRYYGRIKGAPTFQSQIFGKDGYIGTLDTAEGRLLHETMGIDNKQVLRKDFLGVR